MMMKHGVLSEPRPPKSCIARRRFLQYATIAAVANLFPTSILTALARTLDTEKTLSFYNTHTRENLETCYFRRGSYCPKALAHINHILRDHRTDKVKPIDTGLLDLLHALSVSLHSQEPFHIISGYRSPSSNALLRRKSKGVAAFSLHMQGKAVDIRLPRCPGKKLRKAAVNLKRGGVGYYPRLNFIHVDVGRVRYW